MEPTTKYRVLAVDNFHYMEEDNTLEHGQFETYEEALAAAQKIVEESVANHKYDLEMHRQFGDDAILMCPEGTEHPPFKAWVYAAELCDSFRIGFPAHGNRKR